MSFNEVFNDENTFLGIIKDSFSGKGNLTPLDIIPVVGLCGINKMAGKALECLVNGITFDKFLNILISKIFEYMEVNTLSLFLNNLPYDFRMRLNEVIRQEFGPNVNLADLFGIKMSSGGNDKLKDLVTSMNQVPKIKGLFEKMHIHNVEGKEGFPWNDQEQKYLATQIGTMMDFPDSYEDILWPIQQSYNIETRSYNPDVEFEDLPKGRTETKMYKPEAFVKRTIKQMRKKYTFSRQIWADSTKRMASAMGKAYEESGMSEYFEERGKLGELRNQKKDLENKIETIDNNLATWQEEKGNRLRALEALERLHGYDESGGTTMPANRYSELLTYRRELEKITEGRDDLVVQLGTNQIQISELDYSSADFGEDVVEGYKTTVSALDPTNLDPTADGIGDLIAANPSELNKMEQADKAFKETALGVKVDKIFDLVFDELLDFIMEEFALDELFALLKSYPAAEFILDNVENLLGPSCPNTPIMYPPPGDFLKSLKVDVCDPNFSLTLPRLSVPSIDWRFQIQKQFTEIFREAIIKAGQDTDKPGFGRK
mgnify:CR=1 FL=1